MNFGGSKERSSFTGQSRVEVPHRLHSFLNHGRDVDKWLGEEYGRNAKNVETGNVDITQRERQKENGKV